MEGHSFTAHKIHIFLIYDREICLMWHLSRSNYKMKCVRGVVKLTVSEAAGRGGSGGACWGSQAAALQLAHPPLSPVMQLHIQLSTWLEVLIQLSLLDHRYIDSAGWKAGKMTELTASRTGLPPPLVLVLVLAFSGALNRIWKPQLHRRH